MDKDIRLMGGNDGIVENAIEMQRRSQNCLMDIQNVLKRWNCAINPLVEISGRGIQTKFEVIPLGEVPDMKGRG